MRLIPGGVYPLLAPQPACGSPYLGSARALACWRWRPASANFFFLGHARGRAAEVRFGEASRPAREARALPRTLLAPRLIPTDAEGQASRASARVDQRS